MTPAESVRGVVLYLLEVVARAQAAGVAAPSFDMKTLIGLVATLTKVMLDLEGGTGQPTSTPPATTAQDMTQRMQEQIQKFVEAAQAKADAQMRAAYEGMQKKMEELQKGAPQPAGPAPAPG